MTDTENFVTVHRFHDLVAFDSGSMTSTVYLTRELARDFVAALYDVVVSIEDESFTKSEVGTITLDENGPDDVKITRIGTVPVSEGS